MEPKPPAWKSVYTSSTPTSKQHKHAIKQSNKIAAQPGVCNQGSKQNVAVHTAAANGQEPCVAAAVLASNASPLQLHAAACRQNNSRPRSSRPAAAGRHKHLSAATDTATQAQQCSSTPSSASRLSTQQHHLANDSADHAVHGAVPCSSVTGTGPSSTSCCKRLLSPPQPQPKPLAAQHLSPYLAGLPLTARRPRSPGCPRPSSPLSGLSRAARNTDSSATTTAITTHSIVLGSTANAFGSQGNRTSARHSSGKKRPYSQQQSNQLAAFKIQINYGPRPATCTAAANDPAVTSAQQAAAGANAAAGFAAAANASASAAPPAAAVPPTDAAMHGEGSGQHQDRASSCDHLEDPVEQGLGMMLSEYILQMHTTPVACNSVSGLGDESDYANDDMPQDPSSRPRFTDNGSILASWGMQSCSSSSSTAAAAAAEAPMLPMFAVESHLGTPGCLHGTATEADGGSKSTHTVVLSKGGESAVRPTAVGSPFATAAATQHSSMTQQYSTSPNAEEGPTQGNWQQVVVCGSNTSFNSGSSVNDVSSDLGFDPRDCTPHADIIGSGSSSDSSLDLDDAYQASAAGQSTTSNHSSEPNALPRAPSAGTAATGQPGSSIQRGAEAATASPLRPQSSAGRRGVPVPLNSPTKELPAGQRPSGFLMAAANSLDLRPATASASVRNSRSFESGTAARGTPSSRSLAGFQQQRSFTDLDSSSEGFVKEVSLGHLTASLFTPTGADAGVRMPLQHLWGSCDSVSAHSSFSSKAGNQQEQQQQQQQRKQPAGEDCAEASAGKPGSSPQQQHQQYRTSSPQKALSPTRSQKGVKPAGFLQRLTGGPDAATATAYQATAAVAATGWLSSSCGDSGNDCLGKAAATGAGQPTMGMAPGIPAKLGRLTVAGAERAGVAELDTDVEEFSADDVSVSAAAAVAIAAHAAGNNVLSSTLSPAGDAGVTAVMQAWEAPASRHNSHKFSATSGQTQPQIDEQQANTACGQVVWVLASSGRRTKQLTADAANDGGMLMIKAPTADVKQRPRSAAAAACSMHSAIAFDAGGVLGSGVLQQSWSGQLQCQQQTQLTHRPPSRQKPPAEALHLFTSFSSQ